MIESLEEGQGQALAGVAIGRVSEGELGEAAELGDGSIALQDLADEEVGGEQRGEPPLSAPQIEGAAEGVDERGVDKSSGSTPLMRWMACGILSMVASW